MKLTGYRSGGMLRSSRQRGGCAAMTVIELLVALSVGLILMAVVAMLSAYALRSFAAMGNYADLESKSRFAMDRISRDLRQATGVVSYSQSGPDKWIRLTNELEGVRFTYTWYADERVLECDRDGQPVRQYLTGCDEWNFTLYQRTPLPGVTNQFYPTTDAATCKMIEMHWKCSRTFLGQKWNTESAQSVRVALRTNP